MDLQGNALCTPEQAKVWLRREGITGAFEEEAVTLLINGLSDDIANYTLREFAPTNPADDALEPVTRRFSYDGCGWLSLAPYELRTLGAVVGDFGNLGEIILGSDLPLASRQTLVVGSTTVQSQYRLGPRGQTREGTYLWITLPTLATVGSRLVFPGYVNPAFGTLDYMTEVSISGYWGCAAIPGAVRMACLEAVANHFRNPAGVASQSLGGLSFSEEAEFDPDATSALPAKARKLLWRYRRPKPRGIAI